MSENYSGPVCFVGDDHTSEDGRALEGGWHYSVVASPSGGEMPGEKLVLEDDGYHLAEDGDASHNARHSQRMADIVMEDGAPAAHVTEQEMIAIQALLDKLRS